MSQRFNFCFHQNPTGIIDDWNRMRVLVVEALDGNQPILVTDVLQYSNYATHGELIFCSPYTTRTSTNRRYKVCMDKTFELNYRAHGATKVIKYVSKYKGGKLVEFDDNLSAVPTNHQMSIFFYLIAEQFLIRLYLILFVLHTRMLNYFNSDEIIKSLICLFSKKD